MCAMNSSLSERIAETLRTFGADFELVQNRGLPTYEDASGLVVVSVDRDGKEHRLEPTAADSYLLMERAASEDGVPFYIVSAYRGFAQQVEVCRRALENGRSLESTFSSIAPPGCSEHHTGRAVDLGTIGCSELSEVFEDTEAFRWLAKNASKYGFVLSYPKDNQWGFVYEPWHWCFDP